MDNEEMEKEITRYENKISNLLIKLEMEEMEQHETDLNIEYIKLYINRLNNIAYELETRVKHIRKYTNHVTHEYNKFKII